MEEPSILIHTAEEQAFAVEVIMGETIHNELQVVRGEMGRDVSDFDTLETCEILEDKEVFIQYIKCNEMKRGKRTGKCKCKLSGKKQKSHGKDLIFKSINVQLKIEL